MGTNQSMLEGLDRMNYLISRLKVCNMDELVEIIEELTAWTPVLKSHILAQKKQHNQVWNDKYQYDAEEKKVNRVYEEKEAWGWNDGNIFSIKQNR